VPGADVLRPGIAQAHHNFHVPGEAD
jgi:hypothetical protein